MRHRGTSGSTGGRMSVVAALLLGTSALLVAGCADDSGSASNTSRSPASTSSTSTASPTSGTSDGSTSMSQPGSTAPRPGCSTGSTQMPAGTASRETVDVDGDGRPDTLWIHTVDGTTSVGIVTAAGGGSTVEHRSASPIPRSAFVADVGDTDAPLLIVSDGRGASLYAFADCRIQPVLNKQDEIYRFDLQDLRGNGTGIGCAGNGEGRRLVGLQVTDRNGPRVSWTSTVIDIDGLRATNGTTHSGTYTLPADQAKVDLLSGIACGTRTVSEDGVTEQH